MTLERDLPGIRPVRRLAVDAHRESWLVRLDGDEPRPAVLVRARDPLGLRMLRGEAVALHRGRGTGVVPLLDVVADPEGVALLRAHLRGPRLATVLDERDDWQAGEAVAVLAPLTEALVRLHGRGIAHGAVSAAEVVVTAEGAVLCELGHAELFADGAPEAVLARIDAVAADRHALRALAVDLLRRVAGSRAQAARALALELERATGAELLASAQAGLAGLAAPIAPAAAVRTPSQGTPAPQTRLVPVLREDAAVVATPREATSSGVRERARTLLTALRARLDALPTFRRRALVGGAAAIGAAAVLLAVPAMGAASAPSGPAPSGSAAAPASGGQRAPAADMTSRRDDVVDAGDAVIAGDDPIAAALELVARREDCFIELSLLCLEDVDQAGSAALASDRDALQALRDGREAQVVAIAAPAPRLVEQLGGSALVELGPQTAPASLLLMRSEAGWRIRDWIDAAAVD